MLSTVCGVGTQLVYGVCVCVCVCVWCVFVHVFGGNDERALDAESVDTREFIFQPLRGAAFQVYVFSQSPVSRVTKVWQSLTKKAGRSGEPQRPGYTRSSGPPLSISSSLGKLRVRHLGTCPTRRTAGLSFLTSPPCRRHEQCEFIISLQGPVFGEQAREFATVHRLPRKSGLTCSSLSRKC